MIPSFSWQTEDNRETHLLAALLAVIHRDGGHYTEKHGVEKSTADAIQAWYKLMDEKDALEQKAITSIKSEEVLSQPAERETPKGYWYARSEYMRHMGPFNSQEDAWIALTGLDGQPVKGAHPFFSATRL